MKALLRYALLVLFPALFIFSTGCINLDPVADGTHFYILNATRNPNAVTGRTLVLVRNLELADYLNSSQLAQRDGSNRITYLANHRWAGPLDKMVVETIAEAIASRSPDVSATTLTTGTETHYLDVKVLQFDFTPGEQTHLLMEYALFDAATRSLVHRDWIMNQVRISDKSGVEDIVAALEATLRTALEGLPI